MTRMMMLLLVGCLTSQQHASVSQGRICSDNFTCCHTEIEVADPTFHLTQSQYTDTGPTSPSADPITSGAWQGSYWSALPLDDNEMMMMMRKRMRMKMITATIIIVILITTTTTRMMKMTMMIMIMTMTMLMMMLMMKITVLLS